MTIFDDPSAAKYLPLRDLLASVERICASDDSEFGSRRFAVEVNALRGAWKKVEREFG